MSTEATWQEMIGLLEKRGMKLTEIGAQIGLRVSSVSDLKSGASQEPRGMAAVRLHKLYYEKVSVPTKVGRASAKGA